MSEPAWFDWIGVLRHGQSTGNVAREEAEATGHEIIDIDERDADVPLTELGRRQAAAAGEGLARFSPHTVVASPYLRAADTARIAVAAAGLPAEPVVDERLRDRELGVLDLHTSHGVAERWPDELRRKRRLGKFYYRPPGGESWADVVLRLRSLLGDLGRQGTGTRLLFVAHEMTVFALRYLLEGLSEPDLLRNGAGTELANGSITGWEPDARGRYRMTTAYETAHLTDNGTRPTTDDDAAAPLA
jgi:broad specificity phosphatase PhoE